MGAAIVTEPRHWPRLHEGAYTLKKLIATAILASGLVLGTASVASAHSLAVTTPDGVEVVNRGMHPSGAVQQPQHTGGFLVANCALDEAGAAANLNGPSAC